jgi:hypothetical protein
MELGALPKDRNDEVSPWHEAFVNANGLKKINYFDLYIESVLERERFFLVYLNYFG